MTIAPVRVQDGRFVDAHGRDVVLRGINLGGDSKLPIGEGETWLNRDFADHRSVSFVGRPFPLAQADEHLGRLATWGFNCLRLLTTWEAVEHAGPGQYDEEYLDYLTAICAAAARHDLYVFIDFHQDVWSRMTGGSGAPGWTLEAAGLAIEKLEPAGAAITMQQSFDEHDPNPHQPSYPQMVWGSNYRLPANRIMWTLFWAGRTVTPNFLIDGRNIQDVLQDHYFGAMAEVARRVAQLPNVLGFDSLNEPSMGWLGCTLSDPAADQLSPGVRPSPLEALVAAQGIPVDVEVGGLGTTPTRTLLNPGGVRIWRDDMPCPFETAGFYILDGERPIACREDAFQRSADGSAIEIGALFATFFDRVAETIRAFNPDWSLFAEIEVLGPLFGRGYPAAMPERSVSAPHWYDITTLFSKRFDIDRHVDMLSGKVASGPEEVAALFLRGLGQRRALAEAFGPAPTLIGEFGIPFDLNEASAYRLWQEGGAETAFSMHEELLAAMYDALDKLGLHATLWNYTATNRNDPRIGDGWNQEDLSVYSIDQATGGNDGGRAVKGFARPYPRAVQGTLAAFGFDRQQARATIAFDADPGIAAPTEIAVPAAWFPKAPHVEANGPIERLPSPPNIVRVRALERRPIEITISAR